MVYKKKTVNLSSLDWCNFNTGAHIQNSIITVF